MIVRKHTTATTASVARYSACEAYRYSLERSWDVRARRVMFVMLNPSTATEMHNDPTVERCERRARALGFGAFRVTNIFAWRATDPRDMRAATDPVGAQNDVVLAEGARWAHQIIAAWGVHGAHMGRGEQVTRILSAQETPLFHLGLSKAGHPRHPLYISYAQQPIRWNPTPAIP